MRTLIACQTHIRTANEQKLLDVWTAMRDRIDGRLPDLLIIDSAGPLRAQLPAWWNERRILHDDCVPETIGGHTVARFKDALGHPFHDGVLQRSGSDRAFIKMLEIAIASGYDKFAYVEMDLLFALPVQSMFVRMTKPCACGPLVGHGKFPETGLLFLDVEYIWKTDFIAKYNWRGSVVPEGEKRLWNLIGEDLQILPLRGARDAGQTKPGELAELYPDGIDYLTHAHMEVYADFLRMTGFSELAELLNEPNAA